MNLNITLSCGEQDCRIVKDSPLENRKEYISAMLGGTTRNKSGDYVTVVAVEYGDIKGALNQNGQS